VVRVRTRAGIAAVNSTVKMAATQASKTPCGGTASHLAQRFYSTYILGIPLLDSSKRSEASIIVDQISCHGRTRIASSALELPDPIKRRFYSNPREPRHESSRNGAGLENEPEAAKRPRLS
jgi:hypothetical protein